LSSIAGRDIVAIDMTGRRHRSWRRVGAGVSGLALAFQLMLSSLSLVIAAAPANPLTALNSHALCLSDDATAPQPAPPAGGVPAAPAHDHVAFCCLWHQIPGLQPIAALPAQPAAYVHAIAVSPGMAAFNPGPRYDPANARAPPTLA
jgi:hypothetical protein